MQHTIILCPFYQDEACFERFASDVYESTRSIEGYSFSMIVVNDGSGPLNLSAGLPLTIIHLHRNIGHQKAIAIGLSYASKHLAFDNIIVMDCDGEDRPADVQLLINEAGKGNPVVVAKRTNRQEGRKFKTFYFLYKILFAVLTGKKISFGNFMLLSATSARTLVHHSEIWNHLAGAVIKSGIGYTSINIQRGRRYAGQSKMNFRLLLLHGLGAIGVFIEVTAMRLLIFSVIMILLSLLAILIIISIKFFTDEAIPGWATNAVSSMLIVLLQSFLLSLFTIFLYQSSQAQKKFIPALDYNDYVQSVEKN